MLRIFSFGCATYRPRRRASGCSTRALTQILVAEATRSLPTQPCTVQTPLEETTGAMLAQQIALVPVLRAGLGMLDAALEMLPEATVGYVGMERDEATAIANSYYGKLPPLANSAVLLLDPMLATGGSRRRGRFQRLIGGGGSAGQRCSAWWPAPQGVNASPKASRNCISSPQPSTATSTTATILPGLGDFGDRLFGTL